jgi:hypothetical protein
MKKMKITKAQVTQILRWSVFVLAAFTIGVKIAEASAYHSLHIMIENPEVSVYSILVNDGYLFIK